MPLQPLEVVAASLAIGALVGFLIGRWMSLWWFVPIWFGMGAAMVVIWWNNLSANQGIPGILGLMFFLYVMLPGFVASSLGAFVGRRRRARTLASRSDPG